MFCIQCGKELADNSKFCTFCGAAITLHQEPSETANFIVNEPEAAPSVVEPVIENKVLEGEQQAVYQQPINQQPINQYNNADSSMTNPKNVEYPVPVKKKKKSYKILIAAVAFVGVILIGGVIGFFAYQNHIMKQAVNVVALFDEKEYAKALDVYDKYSGKKEAFDNNINEELSKRVELVKTDYLDEKIEYNAAIEQLLAIADYKDDDLVNKTTEITQWVNMINNSRTNYKLAKTLYDDGDYYGALEKYKLVVEEDTSYYALATQDMTLVDEAIKEEELLRQEEERINNLRNEVLLQAANYESTYDYNSAVMIIEEGLSEIIDDATLLDKLSYYQVLNDMATKVNDITPSTYQYTYKENDIDILTVSLELPVLTGDYIVYEAINQVFEDLQEDYIASNDIWAEDTRAYATEEYFYTNSLDLTYAVLYNSNGILCIELDGYSFTGGAHGYPIRIIYTFDLATGNQLDLSDLIAADQNEFWSYVSLEFEKMINENPIEYWDDAMTNIANRGLDFSTVDYALLEEGICIYFFPYDLASYARGFVEVVIPYEGNEWMFTFLNN